MKKQFILMLMMLSAAGCSRRERPVETTPVPTPPAAQPAATNSNADAEAAAAAEAARRETERRRAALQERVHFEFDRSDLDDEARAVLDRKLPLLNSDDTIRLRVDGHADERGSVEYNLALSLRRANAVRAYLLDAGISSARLEVAAYGEEQPLATGSDESAWATNRRAEFRITAGL